MNQNSDNAYFKTTDLNLAAFLSCYNQHVEILDRKDPSRIKFYIKRAEGIDSLIEAYFTHKASVDPQVFAAVLKEIKNRIYNEK